ncbi:MAG: hypothetical protein PWP24_1508, partial [Clostridiales bacterium]|nr:hypothetical protein [Clostridiales bacterium]
MEQIKIQEYRYLAALFTSFDVCWEVMGKLPYFCDAEKRDKKEEYDFIFRGCDADLTIPLWASACMGRGGILWDQTTRFVIEEYEKWGYEEIDMEGKPPDYIGQMYRFLAFLSIKLFDENIKKETILSIQEARDCFERDYVQPVFIALLKEMQTNCKDSVFCAMLENYKRDAGLIDKIEEPIERKRALYTKRSGEIKTAGINNCGGMCTIIAQVEKGCLLSTKSCSDKDSVLGACVRGRGYRKTFLSSQRIRYPMKRIGVRGSGKFERISWEEAISLITKEWIRIKKSYGVASRYVNYATGVTGVMKPAKLARRLLSLDGGFLDYYNSYSSACANYITPYIYGTADSGNSIEDILHTNFLILWGHNPVETMFGAGRSQYLAKLRKQGIRIVVIDPRLSDTAATFADEWIPILPSTDSALADAMAYMIWTEGLQDQTFMDTYCLGFDADHMPEGMPKEENYKAYLFGQMDGIKKTPAWAEKITGVPQDTIIRLAREYATKKPACLLTDLGLQRTRNGEQTIRSTALLTCLTGNVGVKGGSAAGAGWIKEHEPIRLYNQPKNPFSGEIPVFLWTKAVEHGTELDPKVDGIKGVDRLPSNIKMILNLAGNTLINQHSDIKDSIRILSDTSQ